MVCILNGGKEYLMALPGKVVNFEMHPNCGPTVLDKNGMPDGKQPGPRSPFWKNVEAWNKQGRREW